MSENTFQTITSKLWAMANELRGNMDANEFKNYILAFMFYRYLSEHQENYLVTNNVIDVPEGMASSSRDIFMEDISSFENRNSWLGSSGRLFSFIRSKIFFRSQYRDCSSEEPLLISTA